MGSGLLNLMQNGLGNTLGLALVTTVLARRLTYHHSTLDQHQAFSSLSWGEVLAPVHLLVQQAGTPGQPRPAGPGAGQSSSRTAGQRGGLSRLLHAGDAAESAQSAVGATHAPTSGMNWQGHPDVERTPTGSGVVWNTGVGPPVVNGQFLAVGYQLCRDRSY